MIRNRSSLTKSEFEAIGSEVESHTGLNQVLIWAASKPANDVHPQYVAEVITQDEFTDDVIVPYRNIFLVYDTT
jgi:hypothetical protein